MERNAYLKPKKHDGNVMISALMELMSRVADRGSISYVELITLEALAQGVIKCVKELEEL